MRKLCVLWQFDKLSLWQYYIDELAFTSVGTIANSYAIHNSASCGGTKDVEIMVPLKCFSNFWRTLELL